MSLFAYLHDTATHVIAMVPVADAGGKLGPIQGIVDAIREFVLPIVFLAIGIVSIKFLTQRQMTQFFQFAGIALLILLLIIRPEILGAIANWLGDALNTGNSGGTPAGT